MAHPPGHSKSQELEMEAQDLPLELTRMLKAQLPQDPGEEEKEEEEEAQGETTGASIDVSGDQ